MARLHAASGKRRLRDIVAAFLKDRSGANAVEFGIIAAPFLALSVGIIQTFLVFFGQQLLEQVVQQSGRLIMTGQVQAASMTQTQFANAVCSQVVIIFNCNNLMIDVESYSSFSSANTGTPTLTFNAQGQVTNTWNYSPGDPGDVVVVRLMYQWPVFMGPLGFTLSNLSNGNRLIMASAAFQNEP
jgi:Flp pilus assembly protein TadG